MISYLGSLVQFSPAAGRAGCCRQISPCLFSTPRVPATLGLPHTGVSVFSPSTLLRLPAALYGAGPVLSLVPVFGSSTKARIQLRLRVVSSPPQQFRQPEACAPCPRAQRAFSLRGSGPGSQRLVHPLPRRSEPFPSVESGSGSQRLAPPLPGRGAPFPSVAPARAAGRVTAAWFVLRSWPLAETLPAADVGHPESQEVFRQEPGPVCWVGGGGFSGAEFAPFPSPCLLPPAGMGRLFSGVSQPLCFANRCWCVPAG